MGNRQSSATTSTITTPTAIPIDAAATRMPSGGATTTSAPNAATWLMTRLEKKGALAQAAFVQRHRRRRLSTRDSELELSAGKPHSLSEATTLSLGESPAPGFSRGLSSESEDSRTRDPQDDDDDEYATNTKQKPTRAGSGSGTGSMWQHLVGFVTAQGKQCYGPEGVAAATPPASPRKRRRSLAEVEDKHRLFWELVQKLLALNDVVAMIRALQDYLVDHVGASQCAVFLVDPNRNCMSRLMRGHETLSNIEQHRGLVGHAWAAKTSLCRQLFAQDRHYDAEIDLPQESVFQRLISVPLLENNSVYAVVQMTTDDNAGTRDAELDELDMKLLAWLGPILSSCMRKCIEFHDVLLSERTQKALLHIISSSDTEDTVLNLIDGVIAGAGHITKSERISLFMIDWETEELWTLSSSYHEETIRVPLECSTLGHAARHRVTLNVADAQTDGRYIGDLDAKRGIRTRCALYVPVGIENGMNFDETSRPMAVLEILNKEGGDSFSLDDECAFEAFASEVAVILRRRSNEIEYIKLLADTRAEKVLAQRAKSQVNLLECYTEYVANTNANHAADRLRHSFFKNHSRECIVCTEDKQDGTTNCTSIDRMDIGSKCELDSSELRDNGMATMAMSPPPRVTVGPPATEVPLWDLNVFATDADTLPVMVRDMFLDFRIPEILQCDEVTLRNFIFAVRETYHPNPFHNYLHAVSVMHATYAILKTTEAASMLQPLDIAASLIAAYCHDVDHPGHTNTFEIVSKSPLAMLYSDESVLERHHASTTFRILFKEKNANILQNLSVSDYRYLRKMIVTAILSTDMAQHFKMCESMEKMLHPTSHHKSAASLGMAAKRESAPAVIESAASTASASASAHTTSTEVSTAIMNVVREAVLPADTTANGPCHAGGKPLSARVLACSEVEPCATASPYQCGFNGTLEERTFLVKAIVHASDLSGQTFPKPIALKWSNMVSKEFAYQALLEQADNLPVSFHQLDDPLQMVEGQHFFAHKIVSPLWSLLHEMFPGLADRVRNLSENVAHYEHEIQRLKRHKQWVLATSAATDASHACGAGTGGDGSQSDSSNASNEASLWCHSEDEGMAVPGLVRCTPAKFNSFRAMKALSRSVSTSVIDDFGASAIAAIDLARSRSEFPRSRSSSTVSSADAEPDDGDEIFEIGDLNSPKLLSSLR